VGKAEDVETKKSEPSSEYTNRNNSESKAEVKTDAAQNEKKNLSKQMTNLRRLLAVLQETKLILWAMMMMMYVCMYVY
jgi:hypothetical protein